MIDIQAVRDAYALHNICNVSFIRVPNNPGDGLTKIAKSHDLNHLLQTGKCDFIVRQWVIRSQNAPAPTNYLSTATIFYLHS